MSPFEFNKLNVDFALTIAVDSVVVVAVVEVCFILSAVDPQANGHD